MMDKKLSFEEALQKLEGLVKELESGNLELEASVTKYNEGINLAKYCHDLLKDAENVIVKMVKDDELVDFPNTNE
ncbi:MAG: exodeoxyribonuclease VII small subunit [Candidatus Izemoplasmatales bacterium]|jgi:exodeoxyribonuclease VII small subunit|nr:exodeoxyribonuclease VII small subunit [Candidatus Izemoplasmatales bacterium]MDD3864768.1 exodeoxyribonuclease VII small subunit [Candidatus Izemoplasmatales bacterium]